MHKTKKSPPDLVRGVKKERTITDRDGDHMSPAGV